jgi:hypothetical protein
MVKFPSPLFRSPRFAKTFEIRYTEERIFNVSFKTWHYQTIDGAPLAGDLQIAKSPEGRGRTSDRRNGAEERTGLPLPCSLSALFAAAVGCISSVLCQSKVKIYSMNSGLSVQAIGLRSMAREIVALVSSAILRHRFIP